MIIDWYILAPAAFFAGMVDAVVGGGGLIMAVCNLAGSYLGTRLALKHGAGVIRKAFLGVVTVLIVKQLLQIL